MTLSEKIEQISIDKKQAEQIKVIFEVGFAIGIAFHQVTKLTPADGGYDIMKDHYLTLIPDEISRTFDEIMKEYERKTYGI